MKTDDQKNARLETPRQRAPAFRWSWKLVTAAGIDVYVHGTFLLLIAFVAFSRLVAGPGLTAVLRGALPILAIFTTIVLHEFHRVPKHVSNRPPVAGRCDHPGRFPAGLSCYG